MASTVFVDNTTPVIADWLNDVNTATYTTVPTVQVDLASLTTSVQNSDRVTINSISGVDTITGTLTPALTSYQAGQTFRFIAAGANTGATTININGLGAKAITKTGATPLATGDIASGAAVQIVYDGTQFQITSGAGGSSGNTFTQDNLTVPAGTGRSLVGPITFTGTTTISGRLVVL
jgi:hypothetical protein